MNFNWGWIVCGAFLFLSTLYSGVLMSVTNTIDPISTMTDTSIQTLLLLSKLPACISLIGAPLGLWLHYRVATRRVAMAGVILTSLALFSMFWIGNVVILLTVYGVFVGFGSLLLFNSPFFLIGSYFPYKHPKHVLATGLVTCGHGLAVLIFEYVMLYNIGWRWLYAVFSVVVLVLGLPCALAFSPAPEEEEEQGTEYNLNPAVPSEGYSRAEMRSAESGTNFDNRSFSKIADQQQHDDRFEEMALQQNLGPNEIASRNSDGKELGITAILILGGLWFLAALLTYVAYLTPMVNVVLLMNNMKLLQYSPTKMFVLVAICGLFSRMAMSYLGDKLKGKLLYMYVILALNLCVLNAVASFAYNYVHLFIYLMGSSLLSVSIFTWYYMVTMLI